MQYLWRKCAGPAWLKIHSRHLTQRFGPAFALVERVGRKRTLLEISCRTQDEARKLVRELGGRVERLSRRWLQHFAAQARSKPVRIGSRLVVLNSQPKRDPRRQRSTRTRSIFVPAEAAFGTGHHATTAMCLRLLERVTRGLEPGWTMLDAGTGSGILAMAGSCFGAGRVVAIDNDPLASATARRNARLNGTRNIEFSTSDALKQEPTGKFDIITANLFSEIVIEALPLLSRRLAPGGHLILSGILRSQETAVVRALRRHSFTSSEIRRRGKWIALLALLCS